ncbi:Uncharacterised protein [uncultured archaeon]|nr:Uncharacterised protein [uncultured archaeon]
MKNRSVQGIFSDITIQFYYIKTIQKKSNNG